jgi:hypothetical protein
MDLFYFNRFLKPYFLGTVLLLRFCVRVRNRGPITNFGCRSVCRRTKDQRINNVPIVSLPPRLIKLRPHTFRDEEHDFYQAYASASIASYAHLMCKPLTIECMVQSVVSIEDQVQRLHPGGFSAQELRSHPGTPPAPASGLQPPLPCSSRASACYLFGRGSPGAFTRSP